MKVDSEITIRLTIKEAEQLSIVLNRYDRDAPPLIGQIIIALEKELEPCESSQSSQSS